MTDATVDATVPELTRDHVAAFDVPPQIAYFNTANLAPQLHAVRAAGLAALERRARPWTIAAEDWFSDVERLRSLYAGLIGAQPDSVALVPATSYGFAVAAQNPPLSRGDRVLVLAEEYPSGIYTWRRATRAAGAEILTAQRGDGQTWTEAILAVLDERVRIVSVPHVHWTDGALIDLHAVGVRAREVGARPGRRWQPVDWSTRSGPGHDPTRLCGQCGLQVAAGTLWGRLPLRRRGPSRWPAASRAGVGPDHHRPGRADPIRLPHSLARRVDEVRTPTRADRHRKRPSLTGSS